MFFKKRSDGYYHLIGCVVFALTTLHSFVVATEPLRWKFQSGERIEIDVDQNSILEDSNQQPIKIRQRIFQNWKVVDVDSHGAATIEHSVHRVRLTISEQSEEYKVDSDTPDSVDLPSRLRGFWELAKKPMEQSPFRFVLTSMGQVKVSERNPFEDVLKSPNCVLALPKDGANVGEPWTTDSTIQLPASNVSITTSYQLVGQEKLDGRELSKIKTSTAFRLDKGSNAKLASQNAVGLIWFDAAGGKVIRSENQQEIGIELEVGGKTIRQSIQQSTEIAYRFDFPERGLKTDLSR